MPRFVALLRGVNVGNNPLAMERLRALCAEIGLKNPKTYLQSGNVVFDASGSAAKWAKALEEKLVGEARLPVTVFVRTADEIAAILSRNPFLQESGIDRTRLHVTFLANAAAKEASKSLASIAAGPDRFHVSGAEVFLHCPDGYGRSKLSNNVIKKRLSIRATTRNWNTVTKLGEMTVEAGR